MPAAWLTARAAGSFASARRLPGCRSVDSVFWWLRAAILNLPLDSGKFLCLKAWITRFGV